MSGNKKKLYIPVNVRKRKELLVGFGRTEICYTTISVLFGFLFGIFCFMRTNEVGYLVAIPIIVGIITIVVVKKDITNTSLIDNLKELYKFFRSQKTYFYSYNGNGKNEKKNIAKK